MKNKHYIGLVAALTIVFVLSFVVIAVYCAVTRDTSNAIYFGATALIVALVLRKNTVTRLRLFINYPDVEDEQTIKLVTLSKEQLVTSLVVILLVGIASVLTAAINQPVKLYFVKGQILMYILIQIVYQFLIRPAVVDLKSNYIGKSPYFALRNERRERFERVQAVLTWIGILIIPFLVGIGYGQNVLDAILSGLVLSVITLAVIAIGWVIYFAV